MSEGYIEYTKALQAVFDEVVDARRVFPPFNSAHEGYAVLLEEVDELWQEVRAKRGRRHGLQDEARQVAAMAVCFMVEVHDSAEAQEEGD